MNLFNINSFEEYKHMYIEYKNNYIQKMINIASYTDWYDINILNQLKKISDNKHFELVKCLLKREYKLDFDTKDDKNYIEIIKTYPVEIDYNTIYINIMFGNKEYIHYIEDDDENLVIVNNILNQSCLKIFCINNKINVIIKHLFYIYIDYVYMILKTV